MRGFNWEWGNQDGGEGMVKFTSKYVNQNQSVTSKFVTFNFVLLLYTDVAKKLDQKPI